jgi:hypothetical protein
MRSSMVETREKKSFSKRRRFRYFVLIATIEENSFSQSHDVANRINIYKASVNKSGLSFLQANQNLFNSNCKVLSADSLINWS